MEIEATPRVSSLFHESDVSIDLKNRVVLLVDDSAMTRRQIRLYLEREQLQVREAASGEEALERAREESPDLILLDVLMEGMDGYETCFKLKEREALADIPVIFLTGRSEPEDVVRGFKAGASDYIRKPFHAGESISRIMTHLKIRALSQFHQNTISALERMHEAKNRFLRMLSHDLRNPVAAISGLAEIMSEDDNSNLTEDQVLIMDSIMSASQSMVALLNDILDLSTLEKTETTFTPGEHSLVKELSHVVILQRVAANRKQIELDLEVSEVPELVRMDKFNMQRVFENYISNAIKFSPPGSKVRIHAEVENGQVSVRVDDEGPGIPPGEEGRLFREFSRTSIQPTGGEKSTGLGLSICKRIVEMHNGTVGAENRPEGGASFWAKFPVR